MGVLNLGGVQTAVAVWELVLGGWLVSRSSPAGSWAMAVATFTGFAAVSGYLGSKGVANCGCFGAVKASPWAAFAVDLTAIGLLLVAAPTRAEWRRGDAARRLATVGAGVAAVAAAVGLGSYLTYGSAAALLAKLRGEDLVYTGHLDYGSGTSGVPVNRAVWITNVSARTVTVVGGTADGSCVTQADLPVEIAPYQTRAVGIDLNPPAAHGMFTRTCNLLTDSDRMPVLNVSLSVEVVPSQPGPEGSP